MTLVLATAAFFAGPLALTYLLPAQTRRRRRERTGLAPWRFPGGDL